VAQKLSERNPILFAAGSMEHLLPKLITAYKKRGKSADIEMVFGPSSSLCRKIEENEIFDLFIAASTIHTNALQKKGMLKNVQLLGINEMVMVYRKGLSERIEPIEQVLKDQNLIIGISTTGLDPHSNEEPSILKEIGRITGESVPELTKRTRLITGGRETPNAPNGRNQYGWIMETQRVELLFTYFSSALAAVEDNLDLRIVQLPRRLRTAGEYGIGIRPGAGAMAGDFFEWLLSLQANEILFELGFQK
jgi:molybdate transport system substrate-binding protein